jgi:protein-tyrosine phosphatase
VATSHHADTHFETTPDLLREEHRRLVAAVQRERIPIEVLPGAENFLGDEEPERFAARCVPLGEPGRWALFDFSLREPPPTVGAAIDALRSRGLGSVIAHPERNLALMDDPSPLSDWVARGALLQVNAASLLGYLGKDAQEMAEWMLAQDAVHLFASDAHDLARRPFCLGDARKRIAEVSGEAEAARLCQERPWRIARGEPVAVPKLTLPARSRGGRLLRRIRRFPG